MKLKLDAEGHVVLSEGKPVYVHDDGKEVAFDAPATVAKIGQLNGEARAHREAKEAAEGKLKAFEGIEDPSAARDALKRVANLKDGDLIQAGKVEEIKQAAIKAVEEQYKPFVAKAETLERELIGEKIGGSFARSKFISEKAAIPADMVQARFGANFKLEEGRVVAYDQHGNKIYSRANPGELADFDEGLETLISAYPYKDQILKGTGSNGGGARPGAGATGGAKTMSRSDFNRLSPLEQGAKAREGYTFTDD
jgi:hypothetical protein